MDGAQKGQKRSEKEGQEQVEGVAWGQLERFWRDNAFGQL